MAAVTLPTIPITIEEFDLSNSGKVKALAADLEAWPKLFVSKPKNEKFEDYNNIRDLILELLTPFQSPKPIPPNYKATMIAVASTGKKMQGILTYDTKRPSNPNDWIIGFMLSSPWNVMQCEGRVANVGKALINHLATRAKAAPNITRICASAVLSSHTFYKKSGFTREGTTFHTMKVK